MFNPKPWALAFVNSAEYAASEAGDDPVARENAIREITTRFFQLLVKKKRVRHINSIMAEIKNVLNKKRGIVTVSADYAFPPLDEFESILCEVVKKHTRASGVELIGQVKPELIGGYRLRMGDKIIDASIRGQLRKMEASLAAGDGVN